MKELLKTLDTRKKELAALSPMRPEDSERLWKKFRLEWNYNSNHIEGNTLTYQETELILMFDQAPNGTHTVREIEEMKAHDVAIALVREWAGDPLREIAEADIRNLNKVILVRPFWKEAITPDGQPVQRCIKVGDYKEHPNHVRLSNGEIFRYAEPNEVQQKMGDLMAWYRQAANTEHPTVVAARLHYDFVRIHPFDDGNGRVARLLMNYHLLRHNFPPVIIKTADKKNYLAALQRADVGDFEAFVTYIGQQVLWSIDLSIRAAKGQSVEEPGDWEKEVAILERQLRKDIPVQEKSNDLVYQRINDSIFPLFNLLFEKISIFNRLFDKINKNIVFSIPNSGYATDASPEDKVNYFYEQKELHQLQTINIFFRCSGFLSNPNDSNDISIALNIYFKQYQYEVEFTEQKKSIIKNNYTVMISPSEQSDIIEIVGNHLVEKVKGFHSIE